MNKRASQTSQKFFMVYRPDKKIFQRIDFAVPNRKIQQKNIPTFNSQTVLDKPSIQQAAIQQLPTVEIEFQPFVPYPNDQ